MVQIVRTVLFSNVNRQQNIRSSHYSILLRTLPTNKYSRRCGLVQTDLLYYCQVNSETIEHLFWLCPVIKTFLKNIMNIWKSMVILLLFV